MSLFVYVCVWGTVVLLPGAVWMADHLSSLSHKAVIRVVHYHRCGSMLLHFLYSLALIGSNLQVPADLLPADMTCTQHVAVYITSR